MQIRYLRSICSNRAIKYSYTAELSTVYIVSVHKNPAYRPTTSALLNLLKAGFTRHIFLEVWKAPMVVLGHVKGLDSRQPVVKGCMDS